MVKLYHGTRSIFLRSILAEGLRGPSRQKREGGVPLRRYPTLAADPREAMYWADMGSNLSGDPVVLELEVPERYVKPFRPRVLSEHGWYSQELTIPPKYIQQVYNLGETGQIEPRKMHIEWPHRREVRVRGHRRQT